MNRLLLSVALMAVSGCVCVDPSKVSAFKCGEGDICGEATVL